MIVVSDASPVSGLIRIDKIWLLQQLFTTIVIPPKIEQELLVLEQFGYDLHFIKSSDFVTVKTPGNIEMVQELKKYLDEGEAEAITLAKEMQAEYLLIDEKRGRDQALKRNVKVIGTLGVLVLAKRSGLIHLVNPLIAKLRTDANMWISNDVELAVLKSVDEL